MRNIIFIAIFILMAVGFALESFAAKPQQDTVPTQVGIVPAGTTVKIYENLSISMYVTVTVLDHSTNDDSIITIYSSSGGGAGSATVPDLSTTSYTFPVSAFNTMELQCNGAEGYCQYRIDSVFRQ
ncbi:MAG: hypothetical protein ACYSTS_18435 [Planctomycetota bacterium]|jgi:hypothetical protein